MHAIWPWLAVAGIGALHGLNPATGWLFAAACGAQSQNRRQALRALAPLAVGHTASIALVAASVALGWGTDRGVLQMSAATLLLAIGVAHLVARKAGSTRFRMPASRACLALWSFMMSTAHGAGMMLVPALVPLCIGDSPAREITASGSLTLALVAVGVHTAAMLAVTGVLASTVCRRMKRLADWSEKNRGRPMAPLHRALSLAGNQLGQTILQASSKLRRGERPNSLLGSP